MSKEIFEEKERIERPENPKECIITKIHKLKMLFYAEELVGDDNSIVILDKFENRFSDIDEKEARPNNHVGHILGQIQMEFGFINLFKKLKNEGKEESEEAKRYFSIIQTKKSALLGYIELCLDNDDFLSKEISSTDGYWGEQKIDFSNNAKSIKIIDLAAENFVQYSQKNIKEKKGKVEEMIQWKDAA